MGNTEQTIVSIASGTLGLERGIELAGIKTRAVAYVEVEAFIIANLVIAMEAHKLGAAPVWADVKTFPAQSFHRKVHGITAGYPCQPFSNAGKRTGTTDERHIFPHILKCIKSIEPIWCFFENVPGHITLGYDEVYRSLRALGYKVESGIFSANELGAPHQRQRLYILAIKMEYANATTLQRIFFADGKTFSNSRSTSKVADPNSCKYGSDGEFVQKPSKEAKGTTQGKNGQWMWGKLVNGSKNVPNPGSVGNRESLQRAESGMLNANGFKWPAGRGQQQYNWEHPRTIEPGVGCTVDGYNFRTDILRALGNGVVAQTAAKAFINLLNKHCYA